jgi:hypothetical protein
MSAWDKAGHNPSFDTYGIITAVFVAVLVL